MLNSSVVVILCSAITLLSACLIGVCGLLYRSLKEKGQNLLRIESLRRERIEHQVERYHPSFKVSDHFDTDHIVAGVWHGDEYDMRWQPLEPGDVIIDVGANIGVFSRLCHYLGSRAIFSYEPGKRNFEFLKENVGSLPGVHLFCTAVWRSDCGPFEGLALSESFTSGRHSVLFSGHLVDFSTQELLDSTNKPYRTEAVPLDSILDGFSRVKLLKIDCEGSEFPILLTSRRLERIERIVGEIHEQSEPVFRFQDDHSRVPGYKEYRLPALVARLESFGFQVSTRSGRANMYWLDARRIHDTSC